MKQIVRKGSDNVFLLFWVDESTNEIVQDSLITLDFNPILDHLKPKQSLCLLHYQAKPKYLRRFGVWCAGEYYSPESPIISGVGSTALCLDERKLSNPPNAVIVYPRSYFDVERLAIRAINS